MRNIREETELLLELAAASGIQFNKNGRTLNTLTAMRSSSLVVNLVKMGLFSLNIHSMARMGEVHDEDPALARMPFIPSALLGLAFDYAMTAAPRTADDPGVVSIPDLEMHVQKIEAYFGPIDVDQELVSETHRIAGEWLVNGVPDPGAQVA